MWKIVADYVREYKDESPSYHDRKFTVFRISLKKKKKVWMPLSYANSGITFIIDDDTSHINGKASVFTNRSLKMH